MADAGSGVACTAAAVSPVAVEPTAPAGREGEAAAGRAAEAGVPAEGRAPEAEDALED